MTEADDVREAIRETLRGPSLHYPEQLVAYLERTKGFNVKVIREAIWWLIDSRQIRVTPDRKLTIQESKDRVALFTPLMEALDAIINAADNGEWEPLAVAIGEARPALKAAEEVT